MAEQRRFQKGDVIEYLPAAARIGLGDQVGKRGKVLCLSDTDCSRYESEEGWFFHPEHVRLIEPADTSPTADPVVTEHRAQCRNCGRQFDPIMSFTSDGGVGPFCSTRCAGLPARGAFLALKKSVIDKAWEAAEQPKVDPYKEHFRKPSPELLERQKFWQEDAVSTDRLNPSTVAGKLNSAKHYLEMHQAELQRAGLSDDCASPIVWLIKAVEQIALERGGRADGT